MSKEFRGASRVLGVVCGALVSAALVPGCVGAPPETGDTGQSARASRVTVCHVDDEGVVRALEINGNALDAHRAHGDHTPRTFYADADRDGYGSAGSSVVACVAPDGYVANDDDCNDNANAVNPGAAEVCGDAVDNNCDGQVDEGCVVIPSNCTDGSYGGHRYAICQGNLTRPQAAAWCNDQLGWRLAHIDSQGENTFVVDTAYARYGCTHFEQTSYWVANLSAEAPASWPDGSRVWAGGEPSRDGPYVHLIRYCDQRYGWNDVPDSYRWGWVCESP